MIYSYMELKKTNEQENTNEKKTNKKETNQKTDSNYREQMIGRGV